MRRGTIMIAISSAWSASEITPAHRVSRRAGTPIGGRYGGRETGGSLGASYGVISILTSGYPQK